MTDMDTPDTSCRSIFVYGTLRPDCPVEAKWKQPFLSGASSVRKAIIPKKAAELCLLGPYAALALYDTYKKDSDDDGNRNDENLNMKENGTTTVITSKLQRAVTASSASAPSSSPDSNDVEGGDDDDPCFWTKDHEAVQGYVVSFPEEEDEGEGVDNKARLKFWQKQLAYADRVEGYPECYGRELITVELVDGEDDKSSPPHESQHKKVELVQAFTYHRTQDLAVAMRKEINNTTTTNKAEKDKEAEGEQNNGNNEVKPVLTEDDEEYWNILVRLPHGDWVRYVTESGRERHEADDYDSDVASGDGC